MPIKIEQTLLEKIGQENLKKNEAPEELYLALEQAHLEDGSKQAAHQANSEFLAGGRFQHILRSYGIKEGEMYFAERTRSSFQNLVDITHSMIKLGQDNDQTQNSAATAALPRFSAMFSLFKKGEKSPKTEEKSQKIDDHKSQPPRPKSS